MLSAIFDASLFKTTLGDIAFFAFDKVHENAFLANYLKSEVPEARDDYKFSMVNLQRNHSAMVGLFCLLCIPWVVLPFLLLFVDFLQLLFIQTPYQLGISTQKWLERRAWLAKVKQLPDELAEKNYKRQMLVKKFLKTKADDSKELTDTLKGIIALRQYQMPSSKMQLREAMAIRAEFRRLQHRYLHTSRASHPWKNKLFLSAFHQLFLRVLVNLDDLLRLTELSIFMQKKSCDADDFANFIARGTLTGKDSTSVTAISSDDVSLAGWYQSASYSFHEYFVALIVNLTEFSDPIYQKQVTLQEKFHLPERHRLYNLPVMGGELSQHQLWLNLYNVMMTVGVNDYYQKAGESPVELSRLILDLNKSLAFIFSKVDPEHFVFDSSYVNVIKSISVQKPSHIHSPNTAYCPHRAVCGADKLLNETTQYGSFFKQVFASTDETATAQYSYTKS